MIVMMTSVLSIPFPFFFPPHTNIYAYIIIPFPSSPQLKDYQVSTSGEDGGGEGGEAIGGGGGYDHKRLDYFLHFGLCGECARCYHIKNGHTYLYTEVGR